MRRSAAPSGWRLRSSVRSARVGARRHRRAGSPLAGGSARREVPGKAIPEIVADFVELSRQCQALASSTRTASAIFDAILHDAEEGREAGEEADEHEQARGSQGRPEAEQAERGQDPCPFRGRDDGERHLATLTRRPADARGRAAISESAVRGHERALTAGGALVPHHSTRPASSKNPPVGPPVPRVAKRTTTAAACAAERFIW